LDQIVYEGEIESLNNLPYYINENNKSWVKEQHIIDYLCNHDGTFYMSYFIGKTYLNLQNNGGSFPMLNTLIAIHEVFEIIADLEIKTKFESNYEKLVYPFIFQLAKIGARKLDRQKTPLHIMEEMLLKIK
jgi:hypothetical protein